MDESQSTSNPYSSPVSATTAEAEIETAWIEYRRSRGLGTTCIVHIAILLIIYIGLAVATFIHSTYMGDVLITGDGGYFYLQEADPEDFIFHTTYLTIVLLINISQLVLLSMTVFFLIWFYRVYRNLPAMDGKKNEVYSFWTIVAWFIPIVNLFFPLMLVRETWRRSYLPEEENNNDKVPTAIIYWWWGLYMFSIILWILAYLVIAAPFSYTIFNAIIVHDWIKVVSLVILLFAYVLLMGIIDRVSRDQDKRINLRKS